MNKLLYICTAAVKSIKRFKFISFIRIASIYVCLLIVSVILSLYFGSNQYINGSNSFKNIDSLNLYVAESPDKDIAIIPTDLDFEYYASQKRIIYDDLYLGGISLSVISNNYAMIYRDFLAEGKETINDKECIIGKNIADKYKIDLNDTITIGDKNFTVSAITKLPRFSQKILLSDIDVVEVSYPKFYFYKDSVNIEDADKNNIYSHTRIYDYFTKFLNNSSLITIVISCLIVLFYSLMSITNIYKFYNEKLIITNFVQYATGASRATITFQSLIENLIISFISSVFAFISAKCLLNSLMKLTSFYLYLPIYSFGVIIIFAFLLSAILAYINIRMNNKINKEVDWMKYITSVALRRIKNNLATNILIFIQMLIGIIMLTAFLNIRYSF